MTAPPETIIFIASPTGISSSVTFSRGTMMRKPLVGFGAVGMKSVTVSDEMREWGSPCCLLVRKPRTQLPSRGNSTRTVLLKRLRFWERKVATICLTEL